MIYIGMPTSGLIRPESHPALSYATEHPNFQLIYPSSLINLGCNHLLASAINNRCEWFALLHADIAPEDGWVDKLIGEAIKYEADIMTAIVPIKNNLGVTSTGIMHKDTSRLRPAKRFTMKEIWSADFPETFASPYPHGHGSPHHLIPKGFLIANTGCMVCKIGDANGIRKWMDVTKVFFDTRSYITPVKDQTTGKISLAANEFSEDWWFTYQAQLNGAKVMATRTLKLNHADYPNDRPWGMCETDPLAEL